MGKIHVSPAALERSALQILRISEDLYTTSAKMGKVKGLVEEGWESSYTGSYTEELEILKNNLQKLAGNTEELSEMIKNAAADIRRIEEENSRRLGGGS